MVRVSCGRGWTVGPTRPDVGHAGDSRGRSPGSGGLIDTAEARIFDFRIRKEGLQMSEPTTMSSKGQVTVPRDVRERLGLQAGDKIAWSMLSNGTIVLRPKTRRLVDLVGILTQPGQSGVTVNEMRLPE
jgi:AbrB family looped-hinge helix DNA binding protein